MIVADASDFLTYIHSNFMLTQHYRSGSSSTSPTEAMDSESLNDSVREDSYDCTM